MELALSPNSVGPLRASALPLDRPARALTLRETMARLNIKSKASLYAWIKRSDPETRFPGPIKLGRASRWLEHEVDDWLLRQAQRRDAALTA